MGLGFKENAHLRTNAKVFEENFSKIDWSGEKKIEIPKTAPEYIDVGDFSICKTIDEGRDCFYIRKDGSSATTVITIDQLKEFDMYQRVAACMVAMYEEIKESRK